MHKEHRARFCQITCRLSTRSARQNWPIFPPENLSPHGKKSPCEPLYEHANNDARCHDKICGSNVRSRPVFTWESSDRNCVKCANNRVKRQTPAGAPGARWCAPAWREPGGAARQGVRTCSEPPRRRTRNHPADPPTWRRPHAGVASPAGVEGRRRRLGPHHSVSHAAPHRSCGLEPCPRQALRLDARQVAIIRHDRGACLPQLLAEIYP